MKKDKLMSGGKKGKWSWPVEAGVFFGHGVDDIVLIEL